MYNKKKGFIWPPYNKLPTRLRQKNSQDPLSTLLYINTPPRNRAFYSLLLLVFIPAIARNSSQKWGILPSNLTHFAQQSHSLYNAISTLLFHEVSYFTHYYGHQYSQQGHLPAPIKTHLHHELSLYLSKPTFPIT